MLYIHSSAQCNKVSLNFPLQLSPIVLRNLSLNNTRNILYFISETNNILKTQFMRKLFTLHHNISRQLTLQSNFKSISNLTYKPIYFTRNSKSKQNTKQENNKGQQNQKKQSNNTPNPNTQNEQPAQNNNNNFQPKHQKKQVHITGPKVMIELLNKGRVNMIPFYLRNLCTTTKKPSLPCQTNIEAYIQLTNINTEQAKDQQKNKAQQIIEPQQKQQHQPIVETIYKYKSSMRYRERLLKKFKIIQSLKATRNITFNLFDMLSLQDWSFSRIQNNPYLRNLVTKAVFYTLFIAIILIYSGFKIDNNLPYPNNFIGKQNDMTYDQVQQKLHEIKQVRVSTDKQLNHQLTFVLNRQKHLTVIQSIMDALGFNIQKNTILTYDIQNPNLVLDGLQKVQQNVNHSEWIKVKPIQHQYSIIQALLDTLFLATPFIGIAITYWIFRKFNPDSIMKGITSNKKSMKIQSTKDIKVRFKDVAGMEGAKKEITQFVDFLKNSDKYTQIGAKMPKGALLTGPPGTGKTMLAKACAGEAGTSFFYVSGSQFVEMFVGLGASRVRQLFAKARQEAPSIIFIDQIDAIGKKRETSRNEEKDSTLNQMLVQMDGFSSGQTIIVLAATNRKDILDSALTRPGRFDRIVQITLPQIKARQEIFMVHLSPLKVNPNKPLSQIAKRLAQLTPGFSGADIANLCNEAAIIATRKKRHFIQDADFQQASERIMAGYIKKGLSNQKTKKRVAYHEAGHAVCGWFLRGGDPLVKLTIIPRSKGALGYAQYLPKTAYIRTKSELVDQIAIMLGGTTSQQIFLGNMSSGNSDDLQKVYSLARRMVTQFGMGSKTYNLTLDEQRYVLKQSQRLINQMDEEVLEVVNEATNRAKNIIEQRREIIENLAKQLLQKQTLNNEDILRIMGSRPVFG